MYFICFIKQQRAVLGHTNQYRSEFQTLQFLFRLWAIFQKSNLISWQMLSLFLLTYAKYRCQATMQNKALQGGSKIHERPYPKSRKFSSDTSISVLTNKTFVPRKAADILAARHSWTGAALPLQIPQAGDRAQFHR